MSVNKGQQPLDLELPPKSNKQRKGYYLPPDVIDYVKGESDRLSSPDGPGANQGKVSENDVLTAIIRSYQKMAKEKAGDV